MKTIDEIESRLYPPEFRFIVEFDAVHLLTTGKWSVKRTNRRFFLARNCEQAIEAAKIELDDPNYWPPEFHRAENVRARNVPNATPYVGYARFHGRSNLINP